MNTAVITASSPKGRKINRLTQREFFRVCTWLIGATDELADMRSYEAIADRATMVLNSEAGTQVSESSIREAYAETGAPVPLKLRMAGAPSPEASLIVARELLALMSRMGETPSDDLKLLAGRLL